MKFLNYDLIREDMFYLSEKKSINDVKRNIHLPEKSIKLAEFIGILTGDGYIQHDKKAGKYIIEIVGNSVNDKEYLCNKVPMLFKELFNVIPKIYFKKRQQTMSVKAQSKMIFCFLNDLGFPVGKKGQIGIQDWIFENDKFARVFIRGLSDTDGCFTLRQKKYPVVQYSSKSELLLKKVGELLSRFGITYWLGKEGQNDPRFKNPIVVFKLQVSGRKNVLKWLKNVGFSNPYHVKRMGAAGFEPATSPASAVYSPRLSYAPVIYKKKSVGLKSLLYNL